MWTLWPLGVGQVQTSIMKPPVVVLVRGAVIPQPRRGSDASIPNNGRRRGPFATEAGAAGPNAVPALPVMSPPDIAQTPPDIAQAWRGIAQAWQGIAQARSGI